MAEELRHLNPKIDEPEESGRWEVLNPDKQYLTHITHVAMVAANMDEAHPLGWKFVVDRIDKRGKAGHFEIYTPEETEQNN